MGRVWASFEKKRKSEGDDMDGQRDDLNSYRPHNSQDECRGTRRTSGSRREREGG